MPRRLAGCHVPESGRAVVAGGEQLAAVGRELDRVDVAGVAAFELANRLAGGGVPNLCRMVPAAGGDQLAVRRNGGRGHGAVRAVPHDRLARVSRFHSCASLPPIVSTCWPSGANIADQTSPPSLLKSSSGVESIGSVLGIGRCSCPHRRRQDPTATRRLSSDDGEHRRAAVGREADRIERLAGRFHGRELRRIGQPPEPRRAVVAGGERERAVGAIGRATTPIRDA